jgi:monoamine oxidase
VDGVYDAIVIGAGAAGLAAASTLHAAGLATLVLEARDRIGGRVWTDTGWAAIPIELGAEFIHGEGALTHQLAHQAGLTIVEVERFGAGMWWAGQPGAAARPLAAQPAGESALIERLRASYHALPHHDSGPDESLADLLRRQGFAEPAIATADVLLAQTWCASIERLSRADLAREMRVDQAGKREFRIRDGYKRLLDWMARDLNIRLRAPVTIIRSNQYYVEVETPHGLVRGRRCIVTLPVGVLQSGAVQFDPPLRASKQAAIAAFRFEPATKLIYRFHERHWDAGMTYMCHAGLAARWWTPGYGYAEGAAQAVITAYVTSERARDLDARAEPDALGIGLHELAALLGSPALAGSCIAAKRVAWAHDPYARGGYASLPPGLADARLALAESEGTTLLFAGEACAYTTNPQTVHGAIESGRHAARALLQDYDRKQA